MSLNAIARELDLNIRTVRKYSRLTQLPKKTSPKPWPRILAPYQTLPKYAWRRSSSVMVSANLVYYSLFPGPIFFAPCRAREYEYIVSRLPRSRSAQTPHPPDGRCHIDARHRQPLT
jgi:hypothetical protein